MSVVIHSRYSLPPQVSICFSEPSMTQQHFKDECDINQIMAKYQKTGVLFDPLTQSHRQPLFDDFSELGDFLDHQNAVIEAESRFMGLPSSLRARFNNSPAELLQWLQNPENRKEAGELGLMQKVKDSVVIQPDLPIQGEEAKTSD